LRDLVVRFARTYGPFVPNDVASRFGVDPVAELDALAREHRVIEGAFSPLGAEREWCDREVLTLGPQFRSSARTARARKSSPRAGSGVLPPTIAETLTRP